MNGRTDGKSDIEAPPKNYARSKLTMTITKPN